MRLHERFEWDAKKADTNLKKHGIRFELAAEVLLEEEADRYHLEEYDEIHGYSEDRFVTTASHPRHRDLVLVISWIERDSEQGRTTRIISARRATKSERKRYESEIQHP